MIIHRGKPPPHWVILYGFTIQTVHLWIHSFFNSKKTVTFIFSNIWIPHYRNYSCRGIHISAYNFAHYIQHVMNICNGNQMLCTCNYGDKTTINMVNLTYLSFVKSFIKVKFLIRVGHRINIICRTTTKKELIEYYYNYST